MEFAIARAVLAEELGKLQSVIAKKTSVPILSSVIIESTSDNGIRLTATNTESTIYCHVAGNLLAVTQPGKMCIPVTRLIEIVRSLPEGPMKITREETDWIRIVAKRSNLRVPGMSPEQFPEVPSYQDLQWTYVPANYLKSMIPGVKYAITKEESRLNLRGIKLEVEGTEMRMITTDGHRISLASGTLQGLPPQNFEVLIPVGGVEELIKILSDQSETVGISLGPKGLFFQVGSRLLCTSFLSPKFPGYQMPFSMMGTYPTFGNFQADVFAQSIERALLCADKDSICLNFETTQLGMNSLQLNAAEADLGEISEIMDTDFNGGNLKIFVNGRYLLEYLKPLGSKVIRYEIKDGNAQIYLIAEKDGISFYGCVMPMRGPGAK